MKLETISGTEEAKDVLLERDDTDVALDILNELNAAPEDTHWKFTVCRINTDKNGVAINGALEPQVLEGDASIMDDLAGRLREQFGTGRYRVRVLMNKRLWKRFDIAVERPVAPIILTPAPQAPSEMATVLQAMGKQNEQIIALLSSRQTLPVATPTDPLAMFDKIFSIVQKLQPPPAPVETNATEKAYELIMKGVDMAERFGGGREKGFVDLISDALQSPFTAKLLEGLGGAMPTVRLPPALPRRPAVNPTPPSDGKDTPPPPPPVQDDATAEQTKRVQGIIQYLFDKAEHGSSFETYAEWAFDNLPPALIRDILAQPDPVAIMTGLVPAIAPQKQWFTQLIDDLRQLVNSADAAGNQNGGDVLRQPSSVDSNANAGRQGGGADYATDDD